MHRCGFLRGSQIGHLLHVRRERRCELRWQSLAGDLSRIGLLVVHGQDESAIAPCSAVTLVKQRLKHLLGRINLARNTERCGIAVDKIRICRSTLERRLIILLRSGLITGHVARKPSISEQRGLAKAKAGCLIEQAKRFGGILRLERYSSKPRLHSSIIGLDRIGAREEACGGPGVIHVDRRLTRPDQRINIARIGRQTGQVAAEIFSARGAERLDLSGLRLRGSRNKQAAKDP